MPTHPRRRRPLRARRATPATPVPATELEPADVIPPPARVTVPVPTGAGWSPLAVAALRAVILAALGAGIPAAIVALGHVTAGALLPFVPVLIFALRQAEGIVDKSRGQAPQLPGGGGPAEPGAYALDQPGYEALQGDAGEGRLAEGVLVAIVFLALLVALVRVL